MKMNNIEIELAEDAEEICITQNLTGDLADTKTIFITDDQALLVSEWLTKLAVQSHARSIRIR